MDNIYERNRRASEYIGRKQESRAEKKERKLLVFFLAIELLILIVLLSIIK